MARKVIKLNEKQLKNIVSRVISEKTKLKEQSFNPFGGGDGPSTETTTEKIVQYPGDTVWEYTQIKDVWNTRKKGSDKWISLGDSKYKATVDKLAKAFPSGTSGKGEGGAAGEQEEKSSWLDMFKPCVKKFPPKNAGAYKAIYKAVDGFGTNERMLFRALDELNTWEEWTSMNKVIRCATHNDKGMFGKRNKYTNMYDFIADDLSGSDLREFRTILRALKQSKGGGSDQQVADGDQEGTEQGTGGKATVPFKDKKEGDAFRGWINYKYPDYAKQIKLDPSGPFNNAFIAKAYEKYGDVYQKVQAAQA